MYAIGCMSVSILRSDKERDARVIHGGRCGQRMSGEDDARQERLARRALPRVVCRDRKRDCARLDGLALDGEDARRGLARERALQTEVELGCRAEAPVRRVSSPGASGAGGRGRTWRAVAWCLQRPKDDEELVSTIRHPTQTGTRRTHHCTLEKLRCRSVGKRSTISRPPRAALDARRRRLPCGCCLLPLLPLPEGSDVAFLLLQRPWRRSSSSELPELLVVVGRLVLRRLLGELPEAVVDAARRALAPAWAQFEDDNGLPEDVGRRAAAVIARASTM